MDQIVVQGGRPLEGTVRVNGAKNAALPIMAAVLLTEGSTTLHGVPRLRDVQTMADILRALDVAVEWDGPQTLQLSCEATDSTRAPFDLVRRMRGSVCVMGPLLATRGAAALPLPGGCVLGPRPIDLHLKGLSALGAEIRQEGGALRARADHLCGEVIDLLGPRGSTVLGTANVMMAAALAEGRTVIEGAAREPEVADLARFLVACGARVGGIGSRRLIIDGVESLRGTEYAVIPDRIEAGTFLAAAAATGGRITVRGARADHMGANLDVLRRMGVLVRVGEGGVRVSRHRPLRSADVLTATYPGLPTDMQPQLSVLQCLGRGTSRTEERVYPDRFTHVPELERMGACIVRSGSSATVHGTPKLRGAEVRAADLRAGAALVVAGLAAEGTTCISGVEQIDRGYQDLEPRLRGLGADIRRRTVRPGARRKSA